MYKQPSKQKQKGAKGDKTNKADETEEQTGYGDTEQTGHTQQTQRARPAARRQPRQASKQTKQFVIKNYSTHQDSTSVKPNFVSIQYNTAADSNSRPRIKDGSLSFC